MTVRVVKQKLFRIIKHDYFHQLILENIVIVEFPILVTKFLKLCSNEIYLVECELRAPYKK
jgi:hypothetical protein